MVALPSGKQLSIHGPAVNVPSKVDTVCNLLPRLPSQSELVPPGAYEPPEGRKERPTAWNGI